ncbi:DUF3159 domain-containing protein [Protaetiibacter intestinalis]|uniref:DUF3159 domain-containing protein n=1 Tax=Protaetiibacter intestinalis TaxID=2419774 RepID=A0A387BB63_9MICO|nr:DUF3159 domain-containing protein [Protaetiibacter intestinalis]AYF99161.1 DUF3159 domain-containing protein [Protaetiibacter intestinalis]
MPTRDADPTPRESPEERTDGAEAPSFSDAFAAAARRSALGRVAPGEAPTAGALLAAIGGVRGLVESILPPTIFLVVYTLTRQLLPSVLAPLVLAVVFIVARLVARQQVMSAIVGAVGIGISALLALWSGRAADNFLLGLVINVVLVVVMLVSLAVRRPFIGVMVGLLTGDTAWRADAAKVRVAVIATILWAILPAIRLAVELPLYLADDAAALATMKLLLGVPPYAILLWVTWLLIRSAWSIRRGAEPSETA